MAFNDSEQKKTKIVDVVKVVRHDDKNIVVPKDVPLTTIRSAIDAQIKFEETTVAVDGTINGFINEGAYAFYTVLNDRFGFVNAVSTPGMFGPTPPMLRTIPIGIDEFVQVPWGRFELPGVEGFIQTGAVEKDGRYLFQIQAMVKQKNKDIVEEIVRLTQERVRTSPIYGGKAFRLRLKDDYGAILEDPEPKFIPVNENVFNELIFSDDVFDAINTSLFVPIMHTNLVREDRGSLKRGILLSGKYGTGKSMTSAATAYLATKNGWTFIVAERADELADILRLAADYGPSVVFCEDIDQVVSGDRSINMNDILNVIDGVDSKSVEVMIVLTTNHPEKINRAMLRPGRLDAVVNVLPPDANAVEKLFRQYSRGRILDTTDISDICKKMSGNIPAVIREVIDRARLAAIGRVGSLDYEISHDDLLRAANSMTNQLALLEERAEDVRSNDEKAASILAAPIQNLASALSGQNVENLSNGHTTVS